jgi:hypothetical protein
MSARVRGRASSRSIAALISITARLSRSKVASSSAVGSQCMNREIEPEALARLVGWKATLEELVPRLRCSQCGKKAADVAAVAKPRPRRIPKNPH